MLFPVVLDDFKVQVRPWDLWLANKVAISQEVMNKETEPRAQDMTIEEHIVYYAKKNWVNPNLALKIARCESWLNPNAKNKNSSARWLAQFLTQDFQRKDWTWHLSTWTSSSKRYLGYKWDVYNVDHHLEVFTKKLAREWSSAWKSSQRCRGK